MFLMKVDLHGFFMNIYNLIYLGKKCVPVDTARSIQCICFAIVKNAKLTLGIVCRERELISNKICKQV